MKFLASPVASGVFLVLLAFGLKWVLTLASEPAIQQLVRYSLTGIYAGLWFVGAWLLKRVIQYIISGPSNQDGEEGVPKLLFDLFGIVLFIAALIGVVGVVFGKSIGGLLATSGVLTGIIAFAVRDLIADVFAGIALAIEKPFKIGEWLQFGGGTPPETGRVVETNWRAVRMVTVQGRTMVMPNSVLTRREFVNLSKPKQFFRTVKQICVDFSVPPERAVDIILSAIKATPGIVVSQAPLILIDELNERGTVFSIHFWVPDYPAMFLIERQVMVNVINFLNQAGYSPAYPKNEIDLTWRHRREISQELEISSLIRRVKLLKALTSEELDQLESKLAAVSFPANTVIVSEGEQGDSLFIVLTGLVRATIQNGKDEIEVGTIKPGEVFGEMSLLTGSPRNASVTTVTDTALVEIKRHHLQPVLKANPAVIDQLSEIESMRANARDLALNTSTEDMNDIKKLGLKHFLKRQISKFFGVAG
ncbi:MAG: mechanosensitive ion channel family protein [Proteobacteria bacterium]|nr:mechanosensitive ion channel family protein [Pseudomonadota bacterium]MDA1022724.1 mechanosensitive ion channel family protein [Pseudomonadota bacterium]